MTAALKIHTRPSSMLKFSAMARLETPFLDPVSWGALPGPMSVNHYMLRLAHISSRRWLSLT
jgi:hypothetical protein